MKRLSPVVLVGMVFILLSAHALAGRPVPDTGQSRCYDETGTQIACTGTGQDGAYTINPMTFTKLDATGRDLPDDAAEWVMVRDNVTGLIWEVKQNKDGVEDYANHHDADNTYFWYDPDLDWPADGQPGDGIHSFDTRHFLSALNNAHFGGFNDWRLPTSVESQSLVDFSIPSPGPTIQSKYFPNTVSDMYWTLITHANVLQGAWSVSFYNGLNHYGFKDYPWNVVRAVRGRPAQVPSRLVVNDSETVTDRNTGLMWRKATYGDAAYIAALNDCEQMMGGGYDDWRMPTLKELSSLADLGENSPAIDVSVFPDTLSAYYWSSTTNPKTSSEAWAVVFTSGRDEENIKREMAYFHAVRGGQILIPGNIEITSPRQASNWDIGSVMPITWDTAGIGGNVTISLSRDGGLSGHFVDLATTGNDGYYEWEVTGPATVNGYLKITPLSEPAKATSVSLFSIQDYILVEDPIPADFIISETPGSNTASYLIRLTQAPVPNTSVKIRLFSSHTGQCTVSPAVVVLDEDNWSGGAVVTVTAVDDGLDDGDYLCTIAADPIESTDPDYGGMAAPAVRVTVEDDDAPVVRLDSVAPTLFEAYQPITLTISGSGLTEAVVTDMRLVLQEETGAPDWTQQLAFTDAVYMGTQLVAYFPETGTLGQYLLRVVHGTGYVDIPGAVTVETTDFVEGLQRKKAILVAGREDADDLLWPAARDSAVRAFRSLRFQGFSGDNIHFLTHMADIDLDGDGIGDKDGTPFGTNLQTAVTGPFTADADELILYMVDHGGDRVFHLADSNTVTAQDLKGWLDDLQRDRPVRVIVILDACMSGTFLEGLVPGGIHPDSERIVIAGAGPDEPAWFENDGDVSFSRYFWEGVYRFGRLYRAYIHGSDHMVIQTPVADRTEDGGPDAITTELLADNTIPEILIGRGRIAASTPPEIGAVCGDQTLVCGDTAVISVSGVSFPNGGNTVMAQILAPSYEDAPSTEPVTEIPTIKLTDPDRNGTYTAPYDDFTQTGIYRILVFATDSQDVSSVPRITRVTRTCGADDIVGDINRDTETGLIDAIIALKVLAGMDVGGQIRSDYAASGVDVDGLNQVGMAEAIYGLQKAAEVR